MKHWLGVGAQPTDRVLRFLDAAGMRKRDARSNPKKGQPGKKRIEREEAKVAAAAEKAKAAAEAKKAAAEAAAAPRASARARAARRQNSPCPARTSGVLLGEIGAAQGLKGEVRVRSFTEEPGGHRRLWPARGRDGPPRRDRELARRRPRRSSPASRA